VSDTPPTEAVETKAAPQHQEVRRELIEFVKMVVWFLILFLILKNYVIEGYEVQGESMEPTLHDQERILVFKLPHLLSTFGPLQWIEPFEQGDIVVFDSPDDMNKRYIKRVIAQGPRQRGNTVEAGGADSTEDQHVQVKINQDAVFINNQRLDETYLPSSVVFTANTNFETDLGPGHMFVMGDNRGVSKDSRTFGSVENRRIIGRAVLRFWPLSSFGLIK
jgi:signal peptidase I